MLGASRAKTAKYPHRNSPTKKRRRHMSNFPRDDGLSVWYFSPELRDHGVAGGSDRKIRATFPSCSHDPPPHTHTLPPPWPNDQGKQQTSPPTPPPPPYQAPPRSRSASPLQTIQPHSLLIRRCLSNKRPPIIQCVHPASVYGRQGGRGPHMHLLLYAYHTYITRSPPRSFFRTETPTSRPR